MLTAAATLLLSLAARRYLPGPNLWGWRQLHAGPVALGTLLGTLSHCSARCRTARRAVALLGALSHFALDGTVPGDVRPLAPFSLQSPLYGCVSLEVLHVGCLAAGVLGVGLVGWRNARGHTPR